MSGVTTERMLQTRAEKAEKRLAQAELVIEVVRKAVKDAIYTPYFVTTAADHSDPHMVPAYSIGADLTESLRDALAGYENQHSGEQK